MAVRLAAIPLNETHHLGLRSWIESANAPGADFSIHNLPYGVFRQNGSTHPGHIGVAIGHKVLELDRAVACGLVTLPADSVGSEILGVLKGVIDTGGAFKIGWIQVNHN